MVEALGVASEISKSEVLRICSQLDKDLESFRKRELEHVALPYLSCDATYVRGRVGSRVASRGLVVVTGVSANGDREVGTDAVDSEDGAFWAAILG